MKKIISSLLTVVLMFSCVLSFCSCDMHFGEEGEQFSTAKSAYNDITIVYEQVSAVVNMRYNAWYFVNHEAENFEGSDDAENTENMYDAFAERVGLSREDLSEVLEYLNAEKTSDSLREEAFADKIVVGWTELNVDKDRLQEALDDAEKNIDLLTIEYDEITKYRTLQKYHDTVDEYLSFANDASYYNIKVMRDSYEERILEIKNELQSVFE